MSGLKARTGLETDGLLENNPRRPDRLGRKRLEPDRG
jgi:hypothetical protein